MRDLWLSLQICQWNDRKVRQLTKKLYLEIQNEEENDEEGEENDDNSGEDGSESSGDDGGSNGDSEIFVLNHVNRETHFDMSIPCH
jgi:hypothetical protein